MRGGARRLCKLLATCCWVLAIMAASASGAPTFTISGYVQTSGGTGIEGANVAGSSGATSAVTAADGAYSITVSNHWSGTITVSKAEWLITPASKSYSRVSTNLTNENYVAYQPKISGYVKTSGGAALPGAVVSTSDAVSTTTDASGHYEIIVAYGWAGTLSASLAGYNFTSKNYSNVTADQANQDFTGLQPKISGYVRRVDGTVLSGATVSASGSTSATTDASGFYEIAIPYGWGGTLSASFTGCSFTDKNYTNITADQTNQNFTAFQPKISGHVKDDTGAAAADVLITNGSQNVLTDANGYYEITVLAGWSGNISAQKQGYVLDPDNYSYSTVEQNLSGQDFTAIIDMGKYGGGRGTKISPYLIYTPEQLVDFGMQSADWAASCKLMNDIDMAAYLMHPIGDVQTFYSGVFNGNAHIISNLTMSATAIYTGLFGASSGIIKDLGLLNVQIQGNAYNYVGGLVGRNTGTIFECFVEGNVTGTGMYFGLLAGHTVGRIENCYAIGTIQGNAYVGGLAGYGESTITKSCAVVSVIGNAYAGGLVGTTYGFLDLKTCIWNQNIAGVNSAVGEGGAYNAIAATTAQMQNQTIFLQQKWDFAGESINGPDDVWAMPSQTGYPVFFWQTGQEPQLPQFSGGKGTPAEPYLIANRSDFTSIGSNYYLMSRYYKLVTDINFAGAAFRQIGSEAHPFAGVFDGDKHIISNVTCTDSNLPQLGIFGSIGSGGIVRNLGCRNVSNTSLYTTTGGLAGIVDYGTVERCWCTGNVSGMTAALIAARAYNSTICESSSQGEVGGNGSLGGIVGYQIGGIVRDCFSTATVQGGFSGGLIGWAQSSTIERCFASGQILNAYDTDGGLVGFSMSNSYESCFWDVNSSGWSYPVSSLYSDVEFPEGIIGLNTEQMQRQNTFEPNGWDFNSVWGIVENVTYPYLKDLPIPPPAKAVLVAPGDGAKDVLLGTSLNWKRTGGASSQRVYFGTTNPPPLVCEQVQAGFNPSVLATDKLYYWRIDQVGPGGTTVGTIWSFRTMPWAGSGLQTNPFIVADVNQFKAIYTNTDKLDKSYKLGANLDLSGMTWTSANAVNFSGILDGNGYAISNVRIRNIGTSGIGMFKNLYGIVKNLTIINADVNAPNNDRVGVLAGTVYGSTSYPGYPGNIQNCIIQNCKVSGRDYVGGLFGCKTGDACDCQVSGQITGRGCVGGIAGTNDDKMFNCSSTATVKGTSSIGGLAGSHGYYSSGGGETALIDTCRFNGTVNGVDDIGGIAGSTTSASMISDSSAVGVVTGTGSGIGGLAGSNDGLINTSLNNARVTGVTSVGGCIGWTGSYGEVSDCYSSGSVQGTTNVGGLIGLFSADSSWVLIKNCYSTGAVTGSSYVGGLIGKLTSGTVKASYWDIQTSGRTTSAGGTGKTTSELMSISSFNEWGCDQLWTIEDGIDYPRLVWEQHDGVVIGQGWYIGAGTADLPYLVETAEQLERIGCTECLLSRQFKQVADINLASYDGLEGRAAHKVFGISSDAAFTGTFDGNGFTISNLRCIVNNSYTGLFGYSYNGSFKNVRLEHVCIDAGIGDYVGALVGFASWGNISNCQAVDVNVSGRDNVGGLVGQRDYYGSISKSSCQGAVKGRSKIGGLVGLLGIDIDQCYASCDVKATSSYAGGLTGFLSVTNQTVSNCYATGSVYGTNYVGGLVGYLAAGSLKKSYAAVAVSGNNNKGGAVGLCYSSTVNSSYYDTSVSIVQYDSIGAMGRTHGQMTSPATFIGWDFINESTNGNSDIWRLCAPGLEYPQLQFKSAHSDFTCPDGVNLVDFAFFAERWLNTDCQSSNNCEGSDLDKSGNVDMGDLLEFASWWMEGI